MYWHLGRDILERQEREGWGAKVIDRIAADLKMLDEGETCMSGVTVRGPDATREP